MKIYGTIRQLVKAVLTRQSAPNVDTDTTAIYADSTGLVKIIRDDGGAETHHFVAHSQSAGHDITLTTTGTTGVQLPTTGTLATLAGAETLTNKTLSDTTTTIIGATGTNRKIIFDAVTGQADTTTLTIKSGQSASHTLTMPDRTGTLVTGPTSTADNNIARYDSTTGALKAVATTPPTVGDTGIVTLANTVDSTTSAGSLITEGGILSKKLVTSLTGVNIANEGALKLYEATGGGTNYIGLKAPAAVAADKTFILPGVDGTVGQVLKTDGSLALGWADAVTNPYGVALAITDATASTSSSTGALKVTGGVGIALTTDATSVDNGGSLTTAGGAAVKKILYVGTSVQTPQVTGATTLGLTSTNGALTLASTTAGVAITTHSTAGDDFTVNTNKLVVEGDTGYVGIGTAAPNTTLDVTKTSAGVITYPLQLTNQGTSTDNSGVGINFAPFDGTAVTGSMFSKRVGSANYALSIFGYSGGGITIDKDGKVGIGIAAPTVALDVVGAIKATTGVTVATSQDVLANHIAPVSYVPTFTSQAGTPTDNTFVTSTYSRVGKIVTVVLYKTNFSNSSASAWYRATLPIAASSSAGRQRLTIPISVYNGAGKPGTIGVATIDTSASTTTIDFYSDPTQAVNWVGGDTLNMQAMFSYFVD